MLEILSPDEAIDLFAEYYGRGAKADLTIPEQGQVGRIVNALGYHTLAVKLAAARAKRRDLEVVAREYEADKRLGVNLKDGTQAVRAILESSLAALTTPARRLFALLAAFPTAEIGRQGVLAVAEVLELREPRESLEALIDWHLADTAVDQRISPEADRERLRLHPLVHTYAQERLAQWDEEERNGAQIIVAAWYADYANAIPDLELAPDEDNIIGALQVAHQHEGDPEADRIVARICSGIAGFWRSAGRTVVGLTYLPWGVAAAERLAENTREESDRLRAATIVSYLGDLLRRAGRLLEAQAAYQRDLEIRRSTGDRLGEAVVLADLGRIAYQQGHVQDAQARFEESLAIAREVGDRREQARALTELGGVMQGQGHLEEADRYYAQSLAITREVGDRQAEGVMLNNVGRVAQDRGRLGEARAYFEQSLAIRREVGDRPGEGVTLSNLGGIAKDRGQLDEAQAYFEQSLAITREVGDRAGEVRMLSSLADIARQRRNLNDAQRWYEESLATNHELGDRRGVGFVLYRLAEIAEERGDLDRAEALHRESLAIAREIGHVQDTADSLRTLGGFLIEWRGQQEEGCQMLQEALSLYEQLGQADAARGVREMLQRLGCEP